MSSSIIHAHLLKALPQVLQNVISEFNPEHREHTRSLNTEFLKRDICQLNAQGIDVYNLNASASSVHISSFLKKKGLHSEFNEKLYCANCGDEKDMCYFHLDFCSSICSIQHNDDPYYWTGQFH